MDNPNENIEDEEYSEDEESPCNGCAQSNYPDFALEPDEEALKDGVRESSYLLGFIGGINSMGFSEASLMAIVMSKINFGHQKELLRMQLAAEERMATTYSKTPVTNIIGE